MREGIHPNYYQAKVVCNCGNEFVTGSTKQDIHVEVCSKCHSFYTASRRLLLPVDVLTSSIVSMALTPSNKREKIKGLSLRDQAQLLCSFGKTQPQLAAAGRGNDTMKYSGIGVRR